jgi:hypothetical protein
MPLTAFFDANGKLLDIETAALTHGALDRGLDQLFGIKNI